MQTCSETKVQAPRDLELQLRHNIIFFAAVFPGHTVTSVPTLYVTLPSLSGMFGAEFFALSMSTVKNSLFLFQKAVCFISYYFLFMLSIVHVLDFGCSVQRVLHFTAPFSDAAGDYNSDGHHLCIYHELLLLGTAFQGLVPLGGASGPHFWLLAVPFASFEIFTVLRKQRAGYSHPSWYVLSHDFLSASLFDLKARQ
jgi:hypothetical protein